MHSKIHILLFLGHILATSAFAETSNECDTKKPAVSKNSTVDVLCDPSVGALYLKHNQKKRLIWLEANKHKIFYPLIKLEPNADPSLVGEEKSIAFITPKILSTEGRKFIGLTVAERSMQGNGMGQCGAGSEVYFISLEIFKTKILERKRFLVYSCKQNIYFTGDGSGENSSIKMSDDRSVTFKWLDYPGYENSVNGTYDFFTNELTVTENEK
jgi:hypothetical protein